MLHHQEDRPLSQADQTLLSQSGTLDPANLKELSTRNELHITIRATLQLLQLSVDQDAKPVLARQCGIQPTNHAASTWHV